MIGLGINIWPRGAGLPFPSDNLLAWHKKATGITMNGSDVSYWADNYGDYDLEQNTASKQPAYSAGVLTFDGAAHEMSMVSGGRGIYRNRSGVGFYAKMSSRIDQNVKFVMFASVGTSSTSYRFAVAPVNTLEMSLYYRRLDADGGNAQNYTSGGYTADTAFVHGSFVDYTDNERRVYLDGTSMGNSVAGSTGSTSDTDSQVIYVGSSGAANYFDGTIEEMIWTSSKANATEIMDYLATV